MAGLQSIEVQDWKTHTVYKNEYNGNHPVIVNFWRVKLVSLQTTHHGVIPVNSRLGGVRYFCAVSGCVFLHERAAFAAPAVRNRNVACSHERLLGVVRQQRTAEILHRKVGDVCQSAARSHMVKNLRILIIFSYICTDIYWILTVFLQF